MCDNIISIMIMGWQDIQMTEGLTWADMCGTGTASKGPSSSQTGAPKPPKAKSSTRRWVCPKCGTIIRSTKEVRVICADCMELFVKADYFYTTLDHLVKGEHS